ncbi:hypothetical protein BCR42DRAFT_430045 [Absidia repens]|uniref:AAA+ ATPase domain-containing protein n=1 Tax=Absidia repens TaxID=90262 RepID=A0A1X2HLT9_9FUNG|nr:hypothetical protein BCR42DRAFT_430045 [Absidia repens]
MTNEIPPAPATKRGLFDWDLEDDEDLFNDDVGDDTMIGLDDFIQTQEQEQQHDRDEQQSLLQSLRPPPTQHRYSNNTSNSYDPSTFMDDDEDTEHLTYPDDDNPQQSTSSYDNTRNRKERSDEIDKDLFFDDGDTLSDSFYWPSEEQHKQRQPSNMSKDNNVSALSLPPPPNKQRPPRRDYSRPPDTGGFLTASCPRTGKPLYFPLQLKPTSVSSCGGDRLLKQHDGNGGIQLLGTPIRLMLEQIDRENELQAKKIERERNQFFKRKSKKKRYIQHESHALWVEKYKPTIFMDLLGDQRVNREALRWVKQWDYCVFGKKPQDESRRDKALRQYKATFGSSMGNQYEKQHKDEQEDKPKDSLLRPDRKILLLSGPPGFGKTTLAHIIGKHAGYNIVEVNASDDRTGEVVKTKIKSALEMQAILRKPTDEDNKKTTMYTKPNILIIDEIDGASTSGGSDNFIKQLVDLASVEITHKETKPTAGQPGGFQPKTKASNSKKKQQPLLRPIICICNDVYAPVLRPLRLIAHHIQFRKVPMLNIARRLQEICQSEGLNTDLRALSMLAEMTDGDLRSSLNTLQFIRSKSTTFNKEMLTEDQDTGGGGLGKKDMGRSLFATWDDLFTAAHAKKMHHLPKQRGIQADRYVRRLADAISTNGDIEKLMQGCFEAYPLMKFHDEALSKLVEMGDWLDFYDHLSHRANNLHDYSVYGYMSYALVNFHRFFAGSVTQEHRMEYPKVDFEIFSKTKSYENLIKIFLSGIHPAQRRFLSRDQLVLNVVPRLLRILSPEIRPVNKHLIKPKEKETLDRLVNVMLEYGMTFVQHKTEEGQFSYILEPPMEELTRFEGYNQKSVLTSRYAVRQMVTQEIEAERLRRRELTMGELYDGSDKKTLEAPSLKKTSQKDSTIEKAPTDFFGRPIVSKPKPKQASGEAVDDALGHQLESMQVDVIAVSYKYHEGFSNAVKKPMNVHMFL